MKQLRPDAVWNLTLAAAMIFFTASLAVAFWPAETRSSMADTYRKQLDREKIKAKVARAKAATKKAENVSRLWVGDAEAIGARSLDNVSKIAKAHNVKLSAFRPQRAIEAAELEQIPFLTLVEGKYPAVASFVRTLEQPALKLAVGSVQITATDGASDTVSASILLIAYRDPSLKVQAKTITNGTGK